MGSDHEQVKLFRALLVVDGGKQHTAGIDAHHCAGRKVRNGNKCLADKLLRLVIGVYPAQNCAFRAGSVIQRKLQQFFGFGYRVGIRTETRNYRELSSIFWRFPKIKPHKQGHNENYQEFRYAYIGVTFGVRCKLDIPDCPTKKHTSHSNIAALYTKTPRKSSNIMVEFCPSTF